MNKRILLIGMLYMSGILFSARSAEWNMDFGKDWTWEYTDYFMDLISMGFGGKVIEVNDHEYYEFKYQKRQSFTNGAILDDPYPSMSRFIRQENQKTYILTCNGNPVLGDMNVDVEVQELDETLIYDFSKQPGESIILPLMYCTRNEENCTFIIEPYDYMDINGKACKVMKLEDTPSYKNSFAMIESIGVTTGGSLANFSFDVVSGYSSNESVSCIFNLLRVLDKNQNVIYQSPDYDNWRIETEKMINPSVSAEIPNVEYYNLQGIKVADPKPGQLYIERSGSGTRKVIM